MPGESQPPVNVGVDVGTALGDAELTLFRRIPAVWNTLYDIAIGQAPKSANRQACRDLTDTVIKLSTMLKESRGVNPLTIAMEGALDRLDDQKRLELLEKIDSAIQMNVFMMDRDQLNELERQIRIRRQELDALDQLPPSPAP